MKILLAANIESAHTLRWIDALVANDVEVVVFSLSYSGSSAPLTIVNGVKVYSAGFSSAFHTGAGKFRKLLYLKAVQKLKRILKVENPDILHAHYASSYGFISALTAYHPCAISVWGSDIYEFPSGSLLAKKIIGYTLSKADVVMSTSMDMAKETLKYVNKRIEVTPFGVDTEIFNPDVKRIKFEEEDFVIGTVKSLEIVYGIDILLEAFILLKSKFGSLSLKLLLIGQGSLRNSLEKRAEEAGVIQDIVFAGFVENNELPAYFCSMNVFVLPSRSESFGVAALEAAACGLPVIASNTGGIPEVVEDGVSGLLVEPGKPDVLCDAISSLIMDRELLKRMGLDARSLVKKKYEWSSNVRKMIEIYKKVVKGKR